METMPALGQAALDEIGKTAGEHAPAAQKFATMLHAGGPGCIAGIVAAFEEKGWGQIPASWLSDGANLPVTPTQIQSVLGPGQILGFARMIGISPGEAAEKFADWLPTIIKQLTRTS